MRPADRPFYRLSFAVLLCALTLLVVAACVLPGCSDTQIDSVKTAVAAIDAERAAVVEQLDAAVAAKAAIDAELEAMEPGELRDKALAYSARLDTILATGRVWVAKADRAIADLHAALADASDPLDVAGAAVQTAAPLVPAPWGTILSVAGGLAIGLARAWQNRTNARKAVASVNAIVAGALAERPQLADEIQAAQGAGAARIVDEAQGKATVLPF